MKQPKIVTLGNGLRVVLAPQADAPTVTALVMVRAGSEYETKEESGISHFLEHLAFKGTKRHPAPGEIGNALESMGAESNAWTAESHTAYWAKAQAGKAERLLELVSELHLEPVLDAAEVDRERGVIIEEIAMNEDQPSRKVQDLWSELLYGDQPAGRPIAGTKANIRRISRDAIADYRARRYRAPETVVTIAGGFDPAAAASFVRTRFAALDARPASRKPKTKEVQAAPALRLEKKASDQAHLLVGFRAFPLGDRREYDLALLATVLGNGMGSRLFRRIRDELGAAYYVNAWNEESVDHGSLGISVGANVGKVDEVLKAVLEEYARMTETLVSPRELRRARDYSIGALLMGLESSDAIATYYGTNVLLRGRALPVREVVAGLRAVTPESIRRVARSVIRPEGLNLAAIGPDARKEHFSKLLKVR